MFDYQINAIIERWRDLDEGFKTYWDKLDDIDKSFIIDELKDTLYECKPQTV